MKDDLISRQAAIDALDKRFDSIPMELTTEILQLRKDLRELPSAQPEQLDDCPIYGGMCGYPSEKCYECPRHGGAVEKSMWWKESSSAQPDLLDCSDKPWKAAYERGKREVREEIIYCKDCRKHNKGVPEATYLADRCPLILHRGYAQGHEFDYQFCCCAERR